MTEESSILTGEGRTLAVLENGLRVTLAPVFPSNERKSSVRFPDFHAPSIQSSIESTFRSLNQSRSSSSFNLSPLKGVAPTTWAAGFSGGLKTRTISSSPLGRLSPSVLMALPSLNASLEESIETVSALLEFMHRKLWGF